MELSNIISGLEKEWVDFETNRLVDAKVLWVSEKYPGKSSNDLFLEDEFLSEFAYANATTECFSGLAFDLNQKKILKVERYGGTGAGYNGGGARCGNTKDYQLKGIGSNQMVGINQDYMHAYGGADIYTALTETIFSNVLDKVLPLGVVNVMGLILTGHESALDYSPERKCWGVIMVRERCIRPSHFLPCYNYVPQERFAKQLKGDVARTKEVNLLLSSGFKTHNEYVLFLGRFLSSCANQFAFAKTARIMHGALGPSNLSIDGKWLDLPIAGFVGGGVNYGLSSTFYDESKLVLDYLVELLHTYSKYNNCLLNPAPLINYYKEQFNYYSRYHFGFVLGIPSQELMSSFPDDWNQITDSYMSILNSGSEVVRSRAIFNSQDPIFLFLNDLFTSLLNCSPQYSIDSNYCAFRRIITASYDRVKESFSTFEQYVQCIALISIKRAMLARSFYLGEVEREVRIFCEKKIPSEIHSFIDSYAALGSWIFEDLSSESITIFKSNNINIHYSAVDQKYFIMKLGESEFSSFLDFPSLYKATLDIADSELTIFGVNYREFLSHLYFSFHQKNG
jgi:hypothetical protein